MALEKRMQLFSCLPIRMLTDFSRSNSKPQNPSQHNISFPIRQDQGVTSKFIWSLFKLGLQQHWHQNNILKDLLCFRNYGLYICIFIYFSQESYNVGANTAPMCSKSYTMRLKVSIQIQACLPLHPVLWATALTAGPPLRGRNRQLLMLCGFKG